MTANEIVEAVLNGFRIFASWPVLALVLVLLFRKQISDLLSALESISIGGSNARFFKREAEKYPSELREQVISKTLARYLIEGESDDPEGSEMEAEKPISSEEVDGLDVTPPSEADELERNLDDLKNR